MEEINEVNLQEVDQFGQILTDVELNDVGNMLEENLSENIDINENKETQTSEINNQNLGKNAENNTKNNEILEKNEEITDNSLNLGKFKDVNSLLTAYNNLQAEFTKKCQKLSELSKSCDNNANALPQEIWREKVNTFLSNNEEAKPYAKEISELLLNNTELYNSENALEKAWTKVLMNNVLSLKEKMQDKSFVMELINNDSEIKQNIINEYVLQLQNKQSPKLMDTVGASFVISKPEKALNLEEASKLVKAMLK